MQQRFKGLENKRAYFDYEIFEKIEAGLVLHSSEVKSIRASLVKIRDAYAMDHKGAIWLYGMYIAPYPFVREEEKLSPVRLRKLLLHKKEERRLAGLSGRGGYALVPLSLYFNSRGLCKVLIGVAKGKKLYDKRNAERDKSWQREQGRLLKTKGSDS